MHFSFSIADKLVHTAALKNRNLQTSASHCLSRLYCKEENHFSAWHDGHSAWLKNCLFLPFTSCLSSLFHSALPNSAAALLVRTWGHLDLVSLFSDWHADKPSCLTSVGCRWPQIAGPWWMAADRELTATAGRNCADLGTLPLPAAKHFGGHCRSLDLCKHESLSAG